MDLNLQKLITNLTSISNIQEIDSNNAIAIRLSNTVTAQISVIVVAVNEPVNMILPLNVSWLVMDPTSSYYGQILVRVSKTASGQFAFTWVQANYYADVMVAQYYDQTDTELLNQASTIGNASNTVNGTVYLTLAPVNPAIPLAVGDNDPRNSNARPALPHTHPLLPAQQLQTATNVVTISQSAAPLPGQVLLATSPTTARGSH